MQISLKDLDVRYRDYNPDDNPPLLHQKEQLVMSDYPNHEKFCKLSKQEKSWGLLDDTVAIYDRQSWSRCLEQHGAELKGHRVIWRKDVDLYQKKLIQTVRRQRKKAQNRCD